MGIYDGDFWHYDLYEDGKSIDSFSTDSNYFTSDLTQVAVREEGHADLLAENWPGIADQDVIEYLRFWNDETIGKAYPGDEYEYRDEWQVKDFIRRLGLDYPDWFKAPERITTIGPVDFGCRPRGLGRDGTSY